MTSPVTFALSDNGQAAMVLFNGRLRYFFLPETEIVKVRQTVDGQAFAIIVRDKQSFHETGHVWLN